MSDEVDRDGQGHLRKRRVRPREPVHLAEHTEVEVLIPAPPSVDGDDPTGWKAAAALIGFIEDAPADMAENHDQYLYGQPRA